ncbi:hypothetical protein XELAEV_18001063mg [Xenopus laevis]|nr:hypothetical protein XELAEV_18001063mg [Xenopus laevis]
MAATCKSLLTPQMMTSCLAPYLVLAQYSLPRRCFLSVAIFTLTCCKRRRMLWPEQGCQVGGFPAECGY